MALDHLIRSAIRKARAITDTLQVDVVHTPFVSRTPAGKAVYGPPTTRQGLVDRKRRVFQGAVANGTVTLLDNVTLSLDDLLTFPNGDVVTILGANQTLDPDGGSYMTEIFLGASTPGRAI